jgi:hypothetical protein
MDMQRRKVGVYISRMRKSKKYFVNIFPSVWPKADERGKE